MRTRRPLRTHAALVDPPVILIRLGPTVDLRRDQHPVPNLRSPWSHRTGDPTEVDEAVRRSGPSLSEGRQTASRATALAATAVTTSVPVASTTDAADGSDGQVTRLLGYTPSAVRGGRSGA